MPRAVWLTDVHLNFVPADRIARLLLEIAGRRPDCVLIGGDIGEAGSFGPLLVELADALARPIYFVLGNHDYYGSSIAAVRLAARRLSERHPNLHWLPAAEAVALGDDAVLVGHGGWGDGRAADFLSSGVVLNDYLHIADLREAAGLDESRRDGVPLHASDVLTPGLLARLGALGDETAEHFHRVLPAAAAKGRHIIVLTHVPPFREACWHDGHVSDDQWAPHFTCVAAGAALAAFMQAHPDHRMTVLCGHTHSPGRCRPLPNVEVLTGGAQYGDPRVQEVFELE